MEIPIIWPELDDWLRGALAEDVGAGDVTTEATVLPGVRARMKWVVKSETVVAGLFVGRRVFGLLSLDLETVLCAPEGTLALPGDVILEITGPARVLLTAERVALNLAQHACGIATLTRRFVEAVAGTRARVAATRKTLPGLRRIEKYAVTVGGGVPHRFGLDDGVLIKDNHIALAGGITAAVSRARERAHHLLKIEVEVRDLDELEEAIRAGADLVMLDNMTVETMERAVELAHGRVMLEASGNVSLATVGAIAGTGVDLISVGALTHSAAAADISARMKEA